MERGWTARKRPVPAGGRRERHGSRYGHTGQYASLHQIVRQYIHDGPFGCVTHDPLPCRADAVHWRRFTGVPPCESCVWPSERDGRRKNVRLWVATDPFMTSPADNTPGHADVRTEGSTDALPFSPALGTTLDAAKMPRRSTLVDRRVLRITVVSVVLGIGAALIAKILTMLIGLITNLVFYGRVSAAFSSPADAVPHLGWWVVLIPALGGVIVGIMARWGSRAIRGHGIPEAMEQVLLNESKIPPRITFLKPISSAIAIGTGGPFGA